MKYFSSLQPFFHLLLLTAISCNAQTFNVPQPQTPNYENLLSLDESSFAQLQYLPSVNTTAKEITPITIPSISQTHLWKVNTISPTHYADTHNAFFCRLERKVNKKFVMPVRVRLEGF